MAEGTIENLTESELLKLLAERETATARAKDGLGERRRGEFRFTTPNILRTQPSS